LANSAARFGVDRRGRCWTGGSPAL